MGKLTVKGVESLREPGRYSDGDGLHLRIDAAGRRYWILRVMRDGKRRDVSLGSPPKVSLATARRKAAEARDRIVETGLVGKPSELPTFAETARQAHKSYSAGYRNSKHAAQWITTLETAAFPMIGEKKIDLVDRAGVRQVLEPIWLKTPETARRVLQRIDRVIRFAIGEGWRDTTIDMKLVRDSLPQQPRKRGRHFKAMNWREVPAFYASLDYADCTPEVRAALRWLILTASRPGNVRMARWDQIDTTEGKVWAIPAEQMKMGEQHRVPLAPAALAILAGMEPLNGQAHLIFGVRKKNGKIVPMSLDTMRMLMRRMGRDETPHGFRSSFKDWSLAQGYQDHLSEAALAHADQNEIRAAYAREDLLEERRPMMEAWAVFVTGKPGV